MLKIARFLPLILVRLTLVVKISIRRGLGWAPVLRGWRLPLGSIPGAAVGIGAAGAEQGGGVAGIGACLERLFGLLHLGGGGWWWAHATDLCGLRTGLGAVVLAPSTMRSNIMAFIMLSRRGAGRTAAPGVPAGCSRPCFRPSEAVSMSRWTALREASSRQNSYFSAQHFVAGLDLLRHGALVGYPAVAAVVRVPRRCCSAVAAW